MAILYILVSTLFLFFDGQSIACDIFNTEKSSERKFKTHKSINRHIAMVHCLQDMWRLKCVEWRILNSPIIFGKTAQLVCSPVTPNLSSFNTHNVTSWLGGKDYSTLTFIGGTADRRKYAEIQRWHRGKFESILQIYKFDEMDVNVNYSCSIGGCENRKMLSLTPDKFEYHPDKDTTKVLTRFRNGYLDVIVKIIKVYPIPKCTIMFNENIISRGLMTKTSINGIFYIVVQEVEHYVDVCRGQLNVTCVVGKTEISIHQETFNRCRKTKEESPENIEILAICIAGVMLFATCLIGTGFYVIYRKFKKVVYYSVSNKREFVKLERNGVETVSQLPQPDQEGTTNDTGQGEIRESTYL